MVRTLNKTSKIVFEVVEQSNDDSEKIFRFEDVSLRDICYQKFLEDNETELKNLDNELENVEVGKTGFSYYITKSENSYSVWKRDVEEKTITSFEHIKLGDDKPVKTIYKSSLHNELVEIDSKAVRRFLYEYFIDVSEHSIYSRVDKYVSNVNVYQKDLTTVLIVLKSLRPGMIIGKAGGTFEDIKTKLEIELKTSVEIEIVEDKIWQNLY